MCKTKTCRQKCGLCIKTAGSITTTPSVVDTNRILFNAYAQPKMLDGLASLRVSESAEHAKEITTDTALQDAGDQIKETIFKEKEGDELPW